MHLLAQHGDKLFLIRGCPLFVWRLTAGQSQLPRTEKCTAVSGYLDVTSEVYEF